MKWFILAAVVVCIWVGFQLPDGVRAGAHDLKAATASIDFKISAANLLSDCGCDLDDFEMRRETWRSSARPGGASLQPA